MSDPTTRLNTAIEGRYESVREIGEGGMAIVYPADDLRHERQVALKVLKPEGTGFPGRWLGTKRDLSGSRQVATESPNLEVATDGDSPRPVPRNTARLRSWPHG